MSPSRVGPLALLVPLLLAALAATLLLDRSPAAPPEAAARQVPAPPPAPARGFRGELALSGDAEAGALRACLVPLRAEAGARELYEEGLARRLALPPGVGFRLRLEVEGGRVLPGAPRVVDAAGEALRPVAELVGDGPEVDRPLAALLGREPRPLSDRRPESLVLWGRAPGEDPRLVLGDPATPTVLPLVPVELAPEDPCVREPWLLALAPDPGPGAPDAVAPGAATAEEPDDAGTGDGAPDEDRAPAPAPDRSQVDGGDDGHDGHEGDEGGAEDRGAGAAADELDRLRGEVARLELELAREQARRQQRELAWFDYNRALGALGLDEAGVAPFPVDVEEHTAAPPPEAEPPPDPARERAAEVRLALATLLRRESVFGLDLIELGRVGDGVAGPAVFRLLDDRGRLAGSLFAERLRLEGSRAAQLLTIVLEEGYEAHAGERTPFAQGERRIVLPFVDPDPWIERVPELFGDGGVRARKDDGLWDLVGLRERLNELLEADTTLGWYRLKTLGGVAGDELLEVHLEAFHADGRLERRLFADRLRVLPEEPGVRLELAGGASVRGDQKTAFPRGVQQIFLPRADLAAWRAAGIPGLGPPPGGAPPEGAREGTGGAGARAGAERPAASGG